MVTMPNENEGGRDVENMLKDYQVLQEQMKAVAIQIEQLRGQKLEAEKALDELEKASGKVYFTVGGVIVETTKEKALGDLKDRMELNSVRMQSANKQYDELKSKEKDLGDRIMKAYKQSQ